MIKKKEISQNIEIDINDKLNKSEENLSNKKNELNKN